MAEGIPQFNEGSSVHSRKGVSFSLLGSKVTDPSQKAEDLFIEKFILRSDHNEIVAELKDDKNRL